MKKNFGKIIGIVVLVAVVAAGGFGVWNYLSDKKGLNSASKNDGCAKTLKVAVSVNQWGSLAEELANECVSVDVILKSADVDPHEYETQPADVQRITNADLLIVNGAGYDDWAVKAAANSDKVKVLNLAQEMNVEEGANPHLWFSPEYISTAGGLIHNAYISALGAESATLQEKNEKFMGLISTFVADVRAATEKLEGKAFASTEPVADYLGEALKMVKVTPEQYEQAVENEGEVAPQDLNGFLELLKAKGAEILFYNTQEENELTKQIKETAKTAGVKVVEVTEQMPSDYNSLLGWQTAVLGSITS